MVSDGELVHCIKLWNRHVLQYLEPEWLGFGTPLRLAEEDPRLKLEMGNDRVIFKASYDGRIIYDKIEDESYLNNSSKLGRTYES